MVRLRVAYCTVFEMVGFSGYMMVQPKHSLSLIRSHM